MPPPPLRLYAAGSLKAALTDVSAAFGATGGGEIESVFGASGLLRARIEAGERVDVYASANLANAEKLAAAGLSGPPRPFAGNWLCAIVRPGLAVDRATLLDAMLDPSVKLGTSTPVADPSGDYAERVFQLADALVPGATARLEAKALRLTGAEDSPKPPDGRNTYAWIVGAGMADVFLTYVTNAQLARAEVPALRIVPLPTALAVNATLALVAIRGADPRAPALARFIAGPEGRAHLRRYGFEPPNDVYTPADERYSQGASL